MDKADLHDRVVVITGANRGIGAAAVAAFESAGARVAALSRQGSGGGMALRCDVADWDSVREAVDTVLARWGRIDVLVNNAGVIDPIARIAEAEPEAWGRAQDVNLKGVFHGMRAAIPVMRAQGGGTIITVSSGAALRPLEGWSAYCASKAGALMLTQAAHLEEAAHGIRVMGLSPGTVATDMQRQIRASGVNPVSQLPWEDHIPADWPARALVWMCGPGGDRLLGRDLSLRDVDLRREIGLVA
jgi:NAD(P)-dependent dehydrogenase (short-subunit alcohol dehydrogenase family)